MVAKVQSWPRTAASTASVRMHCRHVSLTATSQRWRRQDPDTRKQMKTRHVYSTPDVAAAELAVQALRRAGILQEDISLIARHDIELKEIDDARIERRSDFAQGALKGVIGGGGSGLLVGLIAMVVPPLGLTLAGVAAMTLAGAAVGTWTGMLAGSSVPGTVRQKFEDEIASGHVLLVVDGDEEQLAAAEAALRPLDATQLPFETLTAIS